MSDSSPPPTSPFEHHPRLTAAWLLAMSTLLALGAAELFLRLRVRYDPGYYTAFRVKDAEVVYPWGVIRFNSLGFADDEFDLADERPRVGYIGDSITFGVGAGHGHRVTDLLEAHYPGYQHLNLGSVAKSVDEAQIRTTLRHVEELRLDVVVYLHNLNDILPDPPAGERPLGGPSPARKFLDRYLDWMRGRVYLYTALRNAAKDFLLRAGYGHTGQVAFELYPERHLQVIQQTAERIDRLARALRAAGTELVVVLLPYEMQISAEAASYYREHGVGWGDDFVGLGTQRRLVEHLPEVRTIDAAGAFLDPADPERSRAANGLGEYFVADRGGRMDWNHPNREGHRKIADFLAQRGLLDARAAAPVRPSTS